MPSKGTRAPSVDGTRKGIKVVHIASGDLWAGAEVQLFTLLTELARLPGISVSALLMNYGILEERLQEAGIRVEVADETKLNPWKNLAKAVQIVRLLRPDIVHTHRQKENVLGGLAAKLVPGTLSLRTVHGVDEHRPRLWQVKKRIYRTMDTLAGRYFQHAVVAVSEELQCHLNRGLHIDKIRVIQNGIDAKGVRDNAIEEPAIPGPTQHVKIAFVGRLVRVKRPDIFVQLAGRLARENRNLSFYIFGDGPLQPDIEQEIHSGRLQPRVFLMGFQKNLSSYLARMDVLVITSDHEGLPMAVLEAMALGVPVVAHAVGGVPAALADGRCGTLVSSQDVTAYADVMRDLLSQTDRVSEKAAMAQERVEEVYSAASCARQYADLYQTLIASAAAKRRLPC